MNLVLSILITVFAVCLLCGLFYWYVVQACILQQMRFELFKLRDELRRLALEGKESYSSFAYVYLESFICKCIAFGPYFSLVNLIWFQIKRPGQTSEESSKFRSEASTALLRLHAQALQQVLKIMILNSPLLVIFAAGLALGCWILGRINRMMIFNIAENLVEEYPNGAIA